MAFKNINTAIKQELGRIAGTQHKAWGLRNPSEKSVYVPPLEFNEWLIKGMNYYNQTRGYEFETVRPGLMRIKRPGLPNLLRTLSDYRREHKEYEDNYYL